MISEAEALRTSYWETPLPVIYIHHLPSLFKALGKSFATNEAAVGGLLIQAGTDQTSPGDAAAPAGTAVGF